MSLKVTSVAALAILALSACGKKEEPVMPTPQPEAAAPTAPAEPAISPEKQKALLAALPAEYQSADLAGGEAAFGQCRSCHTIEKGGPNLTGPNLWGVYGSKTAAVPGFDFSDDMKKANWTWDAAHLDKWISGPRDVLPNTKMIFPGIKDPKVRRDVIAFVATNSDG